MIKNGIYSFNLFQTQKTIYFYIFSCELLCAVEEECLQAVAKLLFTEFMKMFKER
jgi:hypothetical protein